VPILIGENTAAAIGDRLSLREVARIAVRGKTEQQAVFTIAISDFA
jgi:hypothetical protein